jgi:hypothetical protein
MLLEYESDEHTSTYCNNLSLNFKEKQRRLMQTRNGERPRGRWGEREMKGGKRGDGTKTDARDEEADK